MTEEPRGDGGHVRRIPRRLARAPIGLYRTARALARSLGLGALSPDSPLPDGAGARIPVVRITPCR